MALTGRPERAPLGPPAGLVDGLTSVGAVLSALSGGVTPEPLALLGERAAVSGLHRRGSTSCGGASRLVAAADGWLAASLPRPDDLAAVAAWLELDGDPVDPWAAITRSAATRSVEVLEHRASLLGLPVAALPPAPLTRPPAPAPFAALPVRVTHRARRPRSRVALPWWSTSRRCGRGPCAGTCSTSPGPASSRWNRPAGPTAPASAPRSFFDLLNAGKASVALDLTTTAGVGALQRLVASADVVVEASRPRALAELGVLADQHLDAPDGPRAWISVTGYGRDADGRGGRVAFGDDAAVGGGLVVWDGDGPCFCADAVADPVSGVVAAAAGLAALAHGGRWLIDVSLAGAAAHLAGPTLDATGWTGPIAPPRCRPSPAAAAPLGHDTHAVLAGLP